MKDDQDIYFKTPEKARTISSLDTASTSDSGDIEVIVVVGGVTKKMKLKDFYSPWDLFIGQYMHCATNVYDFTTIIPCLGGEIYAEDFEHGLDVLGERIDQSRVFRTDDKVTHIRLPDLRDRVIQFDPSLSYGTLEDEGVENNFLNEINFYNRTQSKDLTLNTGSRTVSGTINGRTQSIESERFYKLPDGERYITGHNFTGIGSSLLSGSWWYYPIKGGNNTNWFQYNTPTKTTLTVPSTTVSSSYSFSVPTNPTLDQKSKDYSKIDKVQVSRKTRERTVNSVIGINTGAIKNGIKKKYWLVDSMGRGLLTDTPNIYLLTSTKNPSKGVGENPAIMRSSIPKDIHPYILSTHFCKENTRQTDPMGFTMRLDKTARNAPLNLAKYFSKTSLTYLTQENQNGKKSCIIFSAQENGTLVITPKIGNTVQEFHLLLKAKDYVFSDKNGYTAKAIISKISIQKGTEAATELISPPIEIQWTVKGCYVMLELNYKFKGFDNSKTAIDGSEQAIDNFFFHTISQLNVSSKDIIAKTSESFSSRGIHNRYAPNKNWQFYFKITDDAYIQGSEGSHNQENLAKEFKKECFDEISNMKTRTQDFTNAFIADNKKSLADYIDFDDNIFVLEGMKVKLFYDFSDGEHWIGFRHVVKTNEEDKEYSLLFTRYALPTVESNVAIPFLNVLNASGELEEQSINMKVLQFATKNDTRLSLTEKPFKTKYDHLVDNISTPIIMVAKNKVLMMSIPAIEAKTIKTKIETWTGTRYPKAEAQKAMENLPYYLSNTTNIDDIDDKSNGKKGIFNKGNPSTRFYFRMK